MPSVRSIDLAIAATVSSSLYFAVMIGLVGGFVMQSLIGAGAFSSPLRERKACGSCCSSDALTGKPFWRFWEQGARRETFRATAWEQTYWSNPHGEITMSKEARSGQACAMVTGVPPASAAPASPTANGR